MRTAFTIFFFLSILFSYSSYGQPDAAPGRKTGCSDPRFIAAEQKAYTELVRKRAEIDRWRVDKISAIEKTSKESVDRANRRYLEILNGCKDDDCRSQAKITYDDNTKIDLAFRDKSLKDVRKLAEEKYEEAREAYDEAVNEAIRLYCHAYNATGQTKDVVYSGKICSLEKPFKVIGTYPKMIIEFNFVPGSTATGGTAGYSHTEGEVTVSGTGDYKIEGIDTRSPKIVWNVTMTMSGPRISKVNTDTADINIVLTPLLTNDCKAP